MNRHQILQLMHYESLLPIYAHFNGRAGLRRVEHTMRKGLHIETELLIAFGPTLIAIRPVHHDRTPNGIREYFDNYDHINRGTLESIIEQIEKLLAVYLKANPLKRLNYFGK